MQIEEDEKLKKEAVILQPLFGELYKKYCSGLLSSHDIVGLFILLYLATRRPLRWSNGLLKEPIFDEVQGEEISSLSLESLDREILNILNIQYIYRKLGLKNVESNPVRVFDIFNRLQLAGIKSNAGAYINHSMVKWARGLLPVCLLHYIPSPMEVLQQQARGERVVTMFITLEDLSRQHRSLLTYMNGMQEHSRDPLEFLLHDLKHMDNFIDPATYHEQVGVFRCILDINESKVRTFFTKVLGYHAELWYELEYVISDMNCYSTHLLKYLHAKLHNAGCMKFLEEIKEGGGNIESLSDLDESQEQAFSDFCTFEWCKVLREMGFLRDCNCDHVGKYMNESCISCKRYNLAQKLCEISLLRIKDLQVSEWEELRCYFRSRGKEIIDLRS